MVHAAHPYTMRLNLNVLNHLGINLYSNLAAVVSEAVANSWDADAEHVWIDVDLDNKTISIEDDGLGMTKSEVNERFLQVGYQRRIEIPRTPKFNRPAMGRKGIGKLSLFSIADNVCVHTRKDGETNALSMSLPKIREAIKADDGEYHPDPISPRELRSDVGTRIELSDFRRRLYDTANVLRRRLSRRFSIIGPSNHFEVIVNESTLTPEDRQYYEKAQFVWLLGNTPPELEPLFVNAEKVVKVQQDLFENDHFYGWIASAKEIANLRDADGNSLNDIVVLMRGKLAQEDILQEISETGVYTKYVFGEIFADYLDNDDEEDISTSSRQRLIEDDQRYIELKGMVHTALRQVRRNWNEFKSDSGAASALEVPQINAWFCTLDSGHRALARRMLGTVYKMPVDDAEDRARLIRHMILAFETHKYNQNLERLESVNENNIEALISVFQDLDDIEASMYYQITRERLAMIDTLQTRVDENSKERAIQEHVHKHLWLLDPAWDRATDPDPQMEKRFSDGFTAQELGLTSEESSSRYDIKYRMAYGKHVIVELKRAGRNVKFIELYAQIEKYVQAFRKILVGTNRATESFEIIAVLGQPVREWADSAVRDRHIEALRLANARVVFYDELLDRAKMQYRAYLECSSDAGRVFELVNSITGESIG